MFKTLSKHATHPKIDFFFSVSSLSKKQKTKTKPYISYSFSLRNESSHMISNGFKDTIHTNTKASHHTA